MPETASPIDIPPTVTASPTTAAMASPGTPPPATAGTPPQAGTPPPMAAGSEPETFSTDNLSDMSEASATAAKDAPPRKQIHFLLPIPYVGALIGRNGLTVQKIVSSTGTLINVGSKPENNVFGNRALDRLVTISASEPAGSQADKAMFAALRMILENIQNSTLHELEQEKTPTATFNRMAFMPLKLILPSNPIFASRGAHIRRMIHDFDVYIALAPEYRDAYSSEVVVAVTGSVEKQLAVAASLFEMTGFVKSVPRSLLSFPVNRLISAAPPRGADRVTARSTRRRSTSPFMPGTSQATSAPGTSGAPATGSPTAVAAGSGLPSDSITLLVRRECVGSIIGHNGDVVRSIGRQTSTRIKINSSQFPDLNRVIVTGNQSDIPNALQLIARCMEDSFKVDVISAQVEVPYACLGRVIGKAHANLNEITNTSKAKIDGPFPLTPDASPPGPDTNFIFFVSGNIKSIIISFQMIRLATNNYYRQLSLQQQRAAAAAAAAGSAAAAAAASSSSSATLPAAPMH
ncbi:hypothetical protein H696_01760 [Fonticula alba]|uniref:K Homology domain-containing protein n=1 Tax=Fonticula alba TaxID=691883 RepID=A0A058ZFW9_FONAL|nr:hypothetical protein H696_01760 [Fonticula alba]KCV72367.1 hypothetical protein H696_01760 [Fonticula alba]|eukprot:XP_009493945.1 hypothetical protein H696_01760 [Fonticula alba]